MNLNRLRFCIAHYPLPTIHYPLSTIHYPLPTNSQSLFQHCQRGQLWLLAVLPG